MGRASEDRPTRDALLQPSQSDATPVTELTAKSPFQLVAVDGVAWATWGHGETFQTRSRHLTKAVPGERR